MTSVDSLVQDIKYKLPKEAEIPSIMALVNSDSFNNSGDGHLLKVTTEQIAGSINPDEPRAIGAYAGEKLVGFVRLKKYNGMGEIASIIVNPEYKGRHIGTSLVERAIELGINLNHQTLYVYAKKKSTDDSAYRFFKTLGFNETGATPEKLQQDCNACPMYNTPNCSEVPMVIFLGAYQQTHRRIKVYDN